MQEIHIINKVLSEHTKVIKDMNVLLHELGKIVTEQQNVIKDIAEHYEETIKILKGAGIAIHELGVTNTHHEKTIEKLNKSISHITQDGKEIEKSQKHLNTDLIGFCNRIETQLRDMRVDIETLKSKK